VSELSSEEGLERLGRAEAAARRALQTLEKQFQLTKRSSDSEVLELLSTAEHEAGLALAALRGPEVTGRRFRLSDLSREERLQRLGDAEPAARLALQTIERAVHLARSGSDDDMRELLRTAEHEVDLVLAELRGPLQETWDPVSLLTLYLSGLKASVRTEESS
jgi:hypothetical protein